MQLTDTQLHERYIHLCASVRVDPYQALAMELYSKPSGDFINTTVRWMLESKPLTELVRGYLTGVVNGEYLPRLMQAQELDLPEF